MPEFTTIILTPAVLEALTPEQVVEVATATCSLKLGLSSAGLLRWGCVASDCTDTAAYDGYRPVDSGDLRRCNQAFEAAPAWLQVKMADLLSVFAGEVAINIEEAAKSSAAYAERFAAEAAELRANIESSQRVELVRLSAMEVAIVTDALADFNDDVFDSVDVGDAEDYDNLTCANGYTLGEVDRLLARFAGLRSHAAA
jgi:hypothetical protein